MTLANLQTSRRPALTSTEAKAWWVYLPDASPEARQWCVDFERFGRELSVRLGKIVPDLFRRKLDRAWLALAGCKADLDAIPPSCPPLVRTVLEITFRTTVAYWHYHVSELEEARNQLDLANRLIERAIGSAPYLVPLAGQCYDFHLHFARIARAELQWQKMFEHIEISRDMVYGNLPLCQTLHGPVHLTDVCSFYAKAQPLNEIEAEALRLLGNPETVRAEFNNVCLGATVVPFIVVNWLGSP